MCRAKTMDEFKSILKDILYELEDLRASIEYDEEFMGGSSKLIPPLESGVKQLLADIESGSYEFGKGDLAFMDIANKAGTLYLPFRHLFQRIEKTHQKGLDED